MIIVCRQFFPLKHLGWFDDEVKEHPEVEVPEKLQG